MKTDAITKDYVQDPEVFADIFNYIVYKGQQVIRTEDLIEQDTTEIALPYGANGALIPVQKYRDVQKLYTAMTDGKVDYVLFGAENQTKVHFAMPIRNHLYDALDYAGQGGLKILRKKKRKNGRREKKKALIRSWKG